MIEFDIFSSIDKVQERKMESDQFGKLNRKKIKETKTKKSRKVAHHSGEKEKSEQKTKKSKKVVHQSASGENESHKSPVEIEGKVMPETRSEVKLNVSLHCIYLDS